MKWLEWQEVRGNKWKEVLGEREPLKSRYRMNDCTFRNARRCKNGSKCGASDRCEMCKWAEAEVDAEADAEAEAEAEVEVVCKLKLKRKWKRKY